MEALNDLKKRVLPDSPLLASGSETPETPADHRLTRSASIGYNPVKFAGKLSQRSLVVKALSKQQMIPSGKVQEEVDFFYEKLGIDDFYFSEESVETIAGHILSLYGAKCNSLAGTDGNLHVQLRQEAEDHAVYIDTSYPGVTDTQGPLYEARLEEKYLNYKHDGQKIFRLETFRSSMSGVGKEGQELRSYFVNQCNFVKDDPTEEEYTRLDLVSDKTFLEKATKNTRAIYENMIRAVLSRTGPVIDRYEIEGTTNWRIVIGMRRGSGENFFSAVTDLYHYYGM